MAKKEFYFNKLFFNLEIMFVSEVSYVKTIFGIISILSDVIVYFRSSLQIYNDIFIDKETFDSLSIDITA